MIKGVIYCIRNEINGILYIGKTIQKLKKRWGQHKCAAKRGEESRLYNAINKYGLKNFTIVQIDSSDKISKLDALEIYYIEILNTISPNGYNLTKGGNKCIWSEETLNKRRIANTGKKRTKEQKDKMSQGRKGQPAHNKGKPMSEEQRRKKIGLKHTEETKMKLRNINLGKKQSPETIKKRIDARKHNKERKLFI